MVIEDEGEICIAPTYSSLDKCNNASLDFNVNVRPS